MIIDKLKLSDEIKDKLITKVKEEKISINEYLNQLIINDIDRKMDLGRNFYYDSSSDKFFNPQSEEINLTKIQKKLLLTIISYDGNIVTSQELIKLVWNREDTSIFAFRNMINQIRAKTYYEIIKSHSNKGYSFNLVI